MPLRPEILAAVAEMGFIEPSGIQSLAIPAMLEGRDIIGQAQTGTGKTAAFGMPMLQMLSTKNRHVQGLVLCPTRELAVQVGEEIGRLASQMPRVNVVAVYGGQSIELQIRALSRGAQIVVGTPGRVKDHLLRGTINFDQVSLLVLDEADEMLNMGFREDIEEILESTPAEAQRAFFSATMPPEIRKLCDRYLKNPEHLKIDQPTMTVEAIAQSFYEIKPHRKLDALCRLFEAEKFNKALVFCSTRRMVDELTQFVQNRGFGADSLHGELAQSQRDRVMGRFRSGDLKVLAATDVAARGLDVDDVDLVINFDLPYDHESYVHRVGRTGRAGRSGRAVSIITSSEYYKLRNIMRYTKADIEKAMLPSLGDVLDKKVEGLLTKLAQNLSSGKDLERLDAAVEKSGLSGQPGVVAVLINMLLEKEMGSFDLSKLDDRAEMHDTPQRGPKERGRVDFQGKPRSAGPGGAGGYAGRDSGRGGRGERHSQFGAPGKHVGRPRQHAPGERGKAHNDENMVSLIFNVGRNMDIRPGDLVGAITNESQIPGRDIGGIQLHDRFSVVDVDASQAPRVIDAMNRARIKGLKLAVDLAEDEYSSGDGHRSGHSFGKSKKRRK
jgi:Superfamily II DNA and RNA helicases